MLRVVFEAGTFKAEIRSSATFVLLLNESTHVWPQASGAADRSQRRFVSSGDQDV